MGKEFFFFFMVELARFMVVSLLFRKVKKMHQVSSEGRDKVTIKSYSLTTSWNWEQVTSSNWDQDEIGTKSSFLGPGCEERWYGTHTHKHDGEWDRTAESMMPIFVESGHLVFRSTSAFEGEELRSKKRSPFTTTEVKKNC